MKENYYIGTCNRGSSVGEKGGRIMEGVEGVIWKIAIGRNVQSVVRSVGIEYSVITMDFDYGIVVLGELGW